jgi:hypothetical protein
VANDIADFVRGKAHVHRDPEIMNPDFDFLIASTNVNVGRLSPLVRIKESAIGATAEPLARLLPPDDPLTQKCPAIDLDILSGDEACSGAAEETHRCRDILGNAASTHQRMNE